MANKKSIPLRSLALTAAVAHRTKIVIVPEWEDAAVTLREPSSKAWVKFREHYDNQPQGEDAPKLSSAQEFDRNKMGDVILFIDVLLDEAGVPVFSETDANTVAEIYGPVHARLLRQAMALGNSQEYAEKK